MTPPMQKPYPHEETAPEVRRRLAGRTLSAGVKANPAVRTATSRNTGPRFSRFLTPLRRASESCGRLWRALFAGRENGGCLTLPDPEKLADWYFENLLTISIVTFLTFFVTISMIGSCK